MTNLSLFLKPGREKSVRQRHPWIFSGALDRIEGNPKIGETVEILDNRGSWLARGGYNPFSQIAVRIWTWKHEESVDSELIKTRLDRSLLSRKPLEIKTDAYRVVNAENDGLPGLIIDRYGSFIVVQFLAAAAETWKSDIVQTIGSWPGVSGVYERSDSDVRSKEGLPIQEGLLTGQEPPELVTIRENPWSFLVDIRAGHKTGFYLDQRDSRAAVFDLVSRYTTGGEVLNCFSYTGAFSVAAYSAGASSVLNIDSSAATLRMVSKQLRINGIPMENDYHRIGNAFEILREFRDTGRMFDFVILDPPKLAHAQKDIRKAARAYKDINWLAARILKPRGILLTFSCSGLVSEDLFQKIVFSAMLDAGRDAQVIQKCGQPTDHPFLLTFPEGHYLSGLVCRLLD